VSAQNAAEFKERLSRARRWAIFCMAIWLTGTVCITVVATQNFYTITRLLETSDNATFHSAIDTLGASRGRELLYYLSSELNRLYFQYWNLAQLAVGILALWFVVRVPGATRATRGIVAMLAIVLILMTLLTPPIISVGRSLDFVPRDPPPPALRTFGLLHASYTVATLINFILGVLVTIWIERAGES